MKNFFYQTCHFSVIHHITTSYITPCLPMAYAHPPLVFTPLRLFGDNTDWRMDGNHLHTLCQSVILRLHHRMAC